jgi:hypothetical protein
MSESMAERVEEHREMAAARIAEVRGAREAWVAAIGAQADEMAAAFAAEDREHAAEWAECLRDLNRWEKLWVPMHHPQTVELVRLGEAYASWHAMVHTAMPGLAREAGR